MPVAYTSTTTSFTPVGKPSYSFKSFQGLSSLVREALVEATKKQIEGIHADVRFIVEYMVQHWDQNQTAGIGELVTEMDNFVRYDVHVQMVRCFVDHGCNMMAAKLAWREDY